MCLIPLTYNDIFAFVLFFEVAKEKKNNNNMLTLLREGAISIPHKQEQHANKFHVAQ